MTEEQWVNPFGWHLPMTDQMLADGAFVPLSEPHESVAERLYMLAHLAFDVKVWGTPERSKNYWPAFGDRLDAATTQPDIPGWWNEVMETLPGVPLRRVALLTEKCILMHPATLPGTPVQDMDVLEVIRRCGQDFRDRTRVWAHLRRQRRAEALEALEAEDDPYPPED